MKKLAAGLILAFLASVSPALAQPVTGDTVLQQRPIGSGGPTVNDVSTFAITRSQYNPQLFDHVGDSRTTLINVGGFPGIASNGQSFFNQAAAISGQRYVLGLQQGGSGCRTDQYLSEANIAPILASAARWVVINQGLINDLTANTGNAAVVANGCANTPGSFPYTNNFGETVTSTNVGQLAAQHIITFANRAIAVGKSVIITSETGGASPNAMTQAQIGQMYDATARLQAYAAAKPGQVYFIDFRPAIWAPTTSSTAISNIAGVKSDGVHETVLGGYLEGVVFDNAMKSLIPASDTQIASVNNVNATNPRQLILNPLFTTLTGGTAHSSCTAGITGNIPSGWTLFCSNGSAAITVTSGANAGGFGNDITLAVTCSASSVISFASTIPANNLWTLSDILQFAINVSVASGSSNFSVYNEVNVFTDSGSVDHWGLYAGAGSTYGPGPTTAYSYTLYSLAGGARAGSTSQTSTRAIFNMYCSAAGGGTVTVSRAAFNRLYTYNPTNGSIN